MSRSPDCNAGHLCVNCPWNMPLPAGLVSTSRLSYSLNPSPSCSPAKQLLPNTSERRERKMPIVESCPCKSQSQQSGAHIGQNAEDPGMGAPYRPGGNGGPSNRFTPSALCPPQPCHLPDLCTWRVSILMHTGNPKAFCRSVGLGRGEALQERRMCL